MATINVDIGPPYGTIAVNTNTICAATLTPSRQITPRPAYRLGRRAVHYRASCDRGHRKDAGW
jgi:hypothetical protein